MTPLCHLSLEVGMDADSKPYLTGAPCIGSKCAAWLNLGSYPTDYGRCGLVTPQDQELAVTFDDPALPPSPTPDAEGER